MNKHIIATVLLLGASTAALAQNQGQGGGGDHKVAAAPKSLGLTQDAWNAHLRQRGESHVNPGYVRYAYNPADVFPVRTRESMITTIKLPDDEKLTQAFSGDDQGFQVAIPSPNTIAIKALYPGVDTNLVAYTDDGKVFTFYVRSEGYNSKNISDFLVDVVMPGPTVIEGAQMAPDNPRMTYNAQQQALHDSQNAAETSERVRDPYASQMLDKRAKYRDYSDWTDFDPDTVVEGDLGVYVPRKTSGGTIPYRVFHDDRFTYIDYGPEASQITEWPSPVMVIQGVESPVGFRTTGPNGRLMVIESLGDFVLRNGQREIVVMKRSEINKKNEKSLIEYPVAAATPMRTASDLPPGRPGTLISRPKTVVPQDDKPVTANGEPPSKVVPLPTTRPIAGRQTSLGRTMHGSVRIKELPAPAPAAPVRTVLAVTAASSAPIPAPAEPEAVVKVPSGIASGPGIPGATIPSVTRVAPVSSGQSSQDAAEGAVLGATPTRAAPTPLTSPGIRPSSAASPIGSYKVVTGHGTQDELAGKWKDYQAHYPTLLGSKEIAYQDLPDGKAAMVISPVASISDGMKICGSITDGADCIVKTAR